MLWYMYIVWCTEGVSGYILVWWPGRSPTVIVQQCHTAQGHTATWTHDTVTYCHMNTWHSDILPHEHMTQWHTAIWHSDILPHDTVTYDIVHSATWHSAHCHTTYSRLWLIGIFMSNHTLSWKLMSNFHNWYAGAAIMSYDMTTVHKDLSWQPLGKLYFKYASQKWWVDSLWCQPLSCCCMIDTAWLSQVVLYLWETKQFEKAVSGMIYLSYCSNLFKY